VLCCRLDPESHRQARAAVQDQLHQVVEFARKPVQVVDDCAGVSAVDINEQVAYHATADGRDVTLVAADSLGLRLARSAVAGRLLFPHVSPTTQPVLRPTEQTLTGSDFFDPRQRRPLPRFPAPGQGRALLPFPWVASHDRLGSGEQRPPRVRSAMAISVSGLW